MYKTPPNCGKKEKVNDFDLDHDRDLDPLPQDPLSESSQFFGHLVRWFEGGQLTSLSGDPPKRTKLVKLYLFPKRMCRRT